MSCDFCKNTAIIFLTHFMNGEMEKISLCQACSKDKNLIEKKGLTEVLGEDDIINTNNEMNPITESQNLSEACDCGLTAEVLSKTGRLGCPKCYKTFHSAIEERLVKNHNGLTHTGKQIQVPLTLERLRDRKERLDQTLSQAIKNEAFEEAAQIRDAIISIDAQIANI